MSRTCTLRRIEERLWAYGLWVSLPVLSSVPLYQGAFVAHNPPCANDPRRFIAHHTQWNWIVWTESIILASLFIFELCFLPESLVNKPCYRDVLGFRDIFFQLPRKKEAEDALLASVHEQKAGADLNSSKQTLLCLLYPAIWLAGLAFAVPYGC